MMTQFYNRFKNSLRCKLLAWFLLLALIPMVIVSVVSYNTAKNSLYEASVRSLNMSVNSQVAFVNNWFKYRMIDLESQAENHSTAVFLSELQEAFAQSTMELSEFVSSYQWNKLVHEHSMDLRGFQRLYKYYDVFLIDLDGNILYTNAQEGDLGANLLAGSFADTRFSQAFDYTVKTGSLAFSDIEQYQPSSFASAGFLSTLVFNEDGEKIGVIALQFSASQLESALSVLGE